jgi:N-acetylmuramoyl-L-alanine amidase
MAIISCPSLNFDARADGQSPTMIIIHYTGTKTAEEARARFCDPDPTDSIGRISPHYLIDGDARVYQFVDETARAWHAGRASWGAVTDVNSASIGIEIWNSGHEYDFEDFIPAQIDGLIALIRDIRGRWDIPDRNILGHSDVAPGRKLDPGEKFPWGQLAANGIGIMPLPNHAAVRGGDPDVDVFFASLKSYGYAYTDDKMVLLREFRRHFMPHLLGEPQVTPADQQALFDILAQIRT